ncbi:MAG: hypothetical protein H0T65_01405, partial [Deltaproteobacteria bacterium]|nr:hypothetical protein [Deltaproteobacteria bacterium]
MLAPLPETTPASTGDKSLDDLLNALDAPHGDARANTAEGELYEREPSEEILLARLAQVLGPVGRTELVADMNLSEDEQTEANEQFRLIVPAAHQLSTHVGRLSRVIIGGLRSESADRVLAEHVLSHPSRQARCAIGGALVGQANSWKCDPDRWATKPALEMISATIDLPPSPYTYDSAQRRVGVNAIAITTKGGGFDRMAKYATLEAANEDEQTASAIVTALCQLVPVDEIDPRWFPHLAPLHHHRHGPGVTVPHFYTQFP